jgi:uncharacterized protein YycO
VKLLRPGDVLVVRKEFAATNYFLPGHWPHVALYLGTRSQLVRTGVGEEPYVSTRLEQLAAATPTTAVIVPNPTHEWSGDADTAEHPCVLESMKDGVRIRSVNSPFNSDSIVVVRPRLPERDVATALARAFQHEGKPYDFDFDFSCSHRLVCTEVVYRAYDGVAGVEFTLSKHAGRFALSAGDLLGMALAGQHFEIVAVHAPAHGAAIHSGREAAEIVRRAEKGPVPPVSTV